MTRDTDRYFVGVQNCPPVTCSGPVPSLPCSSYPRFRIQDRRTLDSLGGGRRDLWRRLAVGGEMEGDPAGEDLDPAGSPLGRGAKAVASPPPGRVAQAAAAASPPGLVAQAAASSPSVCLQILGDSTLWKCYLAQAFLSLSEPVKSLQCLLAVSACSIPEQEHQRKRLVVLQVRTFVYDLKRAYYLGIN
ncbi:hypothetical protein SEVIR_8G194650v4 [Setaria viridis]